MNFNELAIAVRNDLKKVAENYPNEKLPKEEQVRCCLYSELSSEFEVVCVERGYGSVDCKSRIEVDLWARHSTGTEWWVEVKRFWHISANGWVHKPDEQLRNWQADLDKLAQVPQDENRVFILIGFLKFEAGSDLSSIHDGAIHRMNQFHPTHRCHHVVFPFLWRNSPVRSLCVTIWKWGRGEAIPSTLRTPIGSAEAFASS